MVHIESPRLRRAGVLGALALAACGGGGGGGSPPAGTTTALFTVPRTGVLAPGADFYSLPFPNDFWRSPGGASGIDLSLYPRPTAFLGTYLDAMGPRLDGFGLNGAIVQRFDLPIDPATLPATAAASMAAGASVYLVDLVAVGASRGTRRPVLFQFETTARSTVGTNWLSALPQPGFPLREQNPYALVVTNRLLAADGTAVLPSADWLAVRGGGVLADPDLVAARAAAQPLLSGLDEPGDDARADVVAAAVFTTQSTTGLVTKLRTRVLQLAAPVLAGLVKTGTTATFSAYDGTYNAPNFQTGLVPYATSGGEIVLDTSDGLPVVQRTETLRVSFTIPLGTAPVSGWPVALFEHGFGGDFHTFQANGTADRLAQRGIAVISIDQVLHGNRNPGGSPAAVFNLQNPLSLRDNVLQGAADGFSLARIPAGATFSVGPDTIDFDASRVFFFGHSLGGTTGVPFLACEPTVKGAVLSGTGGLLLTAMLGTTQPIDLAATIAGLVDDGPLDEFNPILALIQTWMEHSDPVNYGRALAAEPLPGVPAKSVYLSEGLGDPNAPELGIETLAVSVSAGLAAPVLQAVPSLATLPRPVSGNLSGKTVVLCQYQPVTPADAHSVVFVLAAAQQDSARFLQTLALTGTAVVE